MDIINDTDAIPIYQTLCGNIFYFNNKSFVIACTLCNLQFQEPEDFFSHILTDHVYEEIDSSEFEATIESQEEEGRETENDEEMEAVYLDEVYEEEHLKECDDLDVIYDHSDPPISDHHKYSQYVQNFKDLEPVLGSIRKCHWLWNSSRTEKHKIKNSSLSFLRHKYYLAHRITISAKDLEYKLRLLKSMRRFLEHEWGEDEYIKRLEFLDSDVDKKLLECLDEGCDFSTVNEDEFCQHLFDYHFVPDEKIYRCEFCDMRTKTHKTYLRHIKICEPSSEDPPKRQKKGKLKGKPEQVNMQCLTCGEQLGEDIEVFNQHMRQHNKIVKKSQLKPLLHKCETVQAKTSKCPEEKAGDDSECKPARGRTFKRLFPNIKPDEDLECAVCGLVIPFTDVEKFNEHMRMHNKIQLFKCRVCKKLSGSTICEDCLLHDSHSENVIVMTNK